MTTVSPFARIHPNVHLGAGCQVGDFVIIGEPPRGSVSGELPTVIGDGADIRSHTVIYAGNTIGSGFQCGHGVLLRETNTIGDSVSIAARLLHRARAGEFVLSAAVMDALGNDRTTLQAEPLPPLEITRRDPAQLFGVLCDARLDFT